MNRFRAFHKILLSAAASVLLLASQSANAGLVSVEMLGTVEFADGANVAGLTASDTITAFATYEDSLLTGSDVEVINIGLTGGGFGGTLRVDLGSVTLYEFQDIDYAIAFPQLIFVNGRLENLDFSVLLSGGQFFVSQANSPWQILSSDSVPLAGGEWGTGSIPVPVSTSVPEPSILALFGLGLLALVRRRRLGA